MPRIFIWHSLREINKYLFFQYIERKAYLWMQHHFKIDVLGKSKLVYLFLCKLVFSNMYIYIHMYTHNIYILGRVLIYYENLGIIFPTYGILKEYHACCYLQNSCKSLFSPSPEEPWWKQVRGMRSEIYSMT